MKIGTAKIEMKDGKIINVEFQSNISIKLTEDQLKDIKDEDSAGELALSTWFSKVEKTELADRLEYKIQSTKLRSENGICEIQYDLIKL